MLIKVWRVYAYRYNKRYIVEDFFCEEEALEYCQERDWQLINRAGQAFDLGIKRCSVFGKLRIRASARDTIATVLIIGGLLAVLSIDDSQGLMRICETGIAGVAALSSGVYILNA